jgi:hypothetical protein
MYFSTGTIYLANFQLTTETNILDPTYQARIIRHIIYNIDLVGHCQEYFEAAVDKDQQH